VQDVYAGLRVKPKVQLLESEPEEEGQKKIYEELKDEILLYGDSEVGYTVRRRVFNCLSN
jgi:hypothetical protein